MESWRNSTTTTTAEARRISATGRASCGTGAGGVSGAMDLYFGSMTELLQAHAIADSERFLALAREVLDIEADAVRALKARLGEAFLRAHRLMLQTKGRVVVTGMGKSGHVGRKIASTLASTGTPAFFMHPGEASHGDLGMITPHDVVIAHLLLGRVRRDPQGSAVHQAPRRAGDRDHRPGGFHARHARPTCTSTPRSRRKPAR